MSKAKAIMKKTRIIALLVLLIFAIIAIRPAFQEGAAIQGIEQNSTADLAGMLSPPANVKPVFRELITEVDGKPITSVEEYQAAIGAFEEGDVVTIKTKANYIPFGENVEFNTFKKEQIYRLEIQPETRIVELNETELITVNETVIKNITVNGTEEQVEEIVEKTIEVPKTERQTVGLKSIGINVLPAAKTNLKRGLDLQGGTRVLLQPEEEVSDEDIDIIIDNLKRRLNVYGLSDIIVRKSSDLSGNSYILVEVAGANEDEVKDLIGRQGKFEARIGKETVFSGGDDIKYVCRSADCAFAVDPQQGCTEVQGGYSCGFAFSITLSGEAAQRQADITENLQIRTASSGNQYLSEPLDLYLDNEWVDNLSIGADLKGRAVTNIQISGPGSGSTLQEAQADSAQNMKRFQTLLITGSLPVKLNIVKIDQISPLLGSEFTRNAIMVSLFAILSVVVVIIFRYRSAVVGTCVLLSMVAELVLLLGFAALVGWNLDLAAIAGILVAIGTGVDDLIIIIDETLNKTAASLRSWKERLKRAFFIIMAAYFTTLVAMLPLVWAGAGLLKLFGITTIAGITIGVLITRPAFGAAIEELLKE